MKNNPATTNEPVTGPFETEETRGSGRRMLSQRETKEDGRYIIFYTFEDRKEDREDGEA